MKGDDLAALRRNTAIWIGVVLWLGVSYLVALPPAGPYADAMQTAFTVFLALVIPLVSLLIAVAWALALRGRGQQGGSRTPRG
jgi:hypothetical protein